MKAALCCLLACCYCCVTVLLATAASGSQEALIPRELIERLSQSEIRTLSDLRRLLEMHSAENKAVRENKWSANKQRESSHRSSRRKRSVEEAVPAVCKTRTEVFEIPRAQVDSTAANFFIWPPCVEVTRCSGCCNTSNMRCHAHKRAYRTVKVAKIEYVRRKPKLREVQVQLEDHLECVCVSKQHTESRLHTDIR